jgi:hypothetical protein
VPQVLLHILAGTCIQFRLLEACATSLHCLQHFTAGSIIPVADTLAWLQESLGPDGEEAEEAPRITAGTLLGTGPVPKAERPDSRVLLLEYLDMYHGARTQQFSKPQQGRTLPERFTGQLQWAWNKQKQHPVYTTSSSVYGAKPPAVQEMPTVWNGVKGQFTQQFAEPYRNMGLKTSMTPSKVHNMLDA